MQNEKTLEQLTKEYEANMPPDIMNIIKAFDWKKEVRAIVNQNQLMIDVGADLEESIYLMILGVIEAEDLYERLMDVHEIPEDKAKKIIGEIEQQIFNPLYKKITELDTVSKSDPLSSSNAGPTHRDEILAEIEKEPDPIIKLNLNQSVEVKKQDSQMQQSKSLSDSSSVNESIKPFTIASTQEVVSSNPPIESGKIIEGTVENPIKTTLQNQTITVNPEQKTKGYVQDPYREPIE